MKDPEGGGGSLQARPAEAPRAGARRELRQGTARPDWRWERLARNCLCPGQSAPEPRLAGGTARGLSWQASSGSRSPGERRSLAGREAPWRAGGARARRSRTAAYLFLGLAPPERSAGVGCSGGAAA